MITAVAAILGAVAALVYAACRLAGECDDRMELYSLRASARREKQREGDEKVRVYLENLRDAERGDMG